MSEALAEALRELLDSDSGFYMTAIEGDSLDLEDWATRARAALAAYDAEREAALKELADLGQAYDAAPGPAVSEYRLLDKMQNLLDTVRRSPQWDMGNDRMTTPAASPAPMTDYERKVEQKDKDFPNGF